MSTTAGLEEAPVSSGLDSYSTSGLSALDQQASYFEPQPFDWHLPGVQDFFSPTFLETVPLSMDAFLHSRPNTRPTSPPLESSAPPDNIFGLDHLFLPTASDSAGNLDWESVAIAAVLDRFDFEEAAPLWLTDRYRTSSLADAGVAEEAFSMPSPEYLGTALKLYFTRYHPVHIHVHLPTFSPQHHSPISVLAMSANGSMVRFSLLTTHVLELCCRGWERPAASNMHTR
jgi:hypothetical protein